MADAESIDGMEKLSQALRVFGAWQAGEEPGDFTALLDRYPDLRELLAPMGAGIAGEAEGERIGEYRILRELGRGGMGIVHEATHRTLGRRVALKTLSVLSSVNPQALARFKREATLAATLEHPNIVSVFEVGEANGEPFFAMEFLDGTPLDSLLGDSGPGAGLQRDESYRIILQVADALVHAHANGVLHRDIKPANVIVQPDGRTVLTDFGLARQIDAPGMTQAGSFLGTPYYVAPEQAEGSARTGAQADIFSLAAMFYEMLFGERPFEGETSAEVLEQVRSHRPRELARGSSAGDADLRAVLRKALEKDPVLRYASVEAFAADVRACRDHRIVSARHATTFLRLRRWMQRNPLRAAFLLLLLVSTPSLTALAGYLWAKREAIAVGEAKIKRDRFEVAIATAFGKGDEGRLRSAYAAFEQIIEDFDAPEEALVGQLLVLSRLLGAEALTAWREKWSARLAERPLLAAMARSFGTGTASPEWTANREEWTASDYFLAGLYFSSEGGRQGDDGAARGAVDFLGIAALRSNRLHHLCALARAARHANDDRVLTRTAEVLERDHGDNSAALSTLAHVLRDTDPERAMRLAAKSPDDPDALASLGGMQSRGGLRSQATASFDKALRIDPQHVPARIGRARLALADERIEAAREDLWHALAQLEKSHAQAAPFDVTMGSGAGSEFHSAQILEQGQDDWIVDLAICLIDVGELDAAVELLQKDRGLTVAAEEPLAGVAEALFHAARFEDARGLLERRIREGTSHPMAWLVLAKILNEIEDYEKALAAVRYAVAGMPGLPKPRYVEAVILHNLDRLEEAESILAEEARKDPDNEQIHGVMISVQRRQRDFLGAVEEERRYAAALFRSGRPAEAARTLRTLFPFRNVGLAELQRLEPLLAAELELYEAAAKKPNKN